MGKLLLQDSKEDSSVHKDGILKANKLFEVGMRLEAGDRLSPWVVRPARIEDVLPLEGVYCMCVYLLCIQAMYIHIYGTATYVWDFQYNVEGIFTNFKGNIVHGEETCSNTNFHE